MKVAIVFCVAIFAASPASSRGSYDETEEEWNLFKIAYNKSYDDDIEDTLRKSVYLENKLKIERHNKLYENGEVSYTLGMNHFGDLTGQEFLQKMNGFKFSLDDIDTNNTFVKSENVSIPNSVNWISKGYVTPVKHQHSCGSCWSFSATGAIEGQHFRKTGKLISLSEQNLIDCSQKYGNHGCDGGTPQKAFKYVQDNGGIDTEKSYPYKNRVSRCQYKRQAVGAEIKGYRTVESGDRNLLAAVASAGPVSVAVEVTRGFQLYKRGVYRPDRRCGDKLNHAVLVVGYGTARDGAKYWTLKNSWGAGWGANGYMYMTRDAANACGISEYASYPVA